MPKIGIFECVLYCITLQNQEGRILYELFQRNLQTTIPWVFQNYHKFDLTYRDCSCDLGNRIFQFQVSEFHVFAISLVMFSFSQVGQFMFFHNLFCLPWFLLHVQHILSSPQPFLFWAYCVCVHSINSFCGVCIWILVHYIYLKLVSHQQGFFLFLQYYPSFSMTSSLRGPTVK